MTALTERAASLLGSALTGNVSLGGGNLSRIERIAFGDGREAVVKTGPAPRVEAAMLRAIATSGAPVPAVLAVDDEILVLAYLRGQAGPHHAWADLGRVVALLHAARGEQYGWEADYAFGDVRIDNRQGTDWPSFWAERRLLIHLPHLPRDLGARIEALVRTLADRLPSRPHAALLHGDLWGGNVLAANGRVGGLIDPACYHGHVEVDLAMLGLFDRPEPDFFSAYGPLEPDYDERRPVYALWPALVHLRLFGAGYRPMVDGLLREAGF